MSIVVWDGKTIAADRIATSGSLKIRSSKIRRLSNGDIVAWTGSASGGIAMANWWESGADPNTFPPSQKTDDWSRLIVVSKGKVFSFEQVPVKIPEMNPFMAWGSGQDFAMGAMAYGASAVEAIKVASRLCTTCGMGVESFRVR